jgi:hypothetical protein
MQNGVRRLHHRPQLGLLRRVDRLQDFRSADDVAGVLHLGNQDGVRGRTRSRQDVGGSPRRFERVRPDDDLAPAIAALLDDRADFLPGFDLGVGRDRVLKIEDQGVGRQRSRFLQCTVVGAGHIENAASGTDRGHAGCLVVRRRCCDAK